MFVLQRRPDVLPNLLSPHTPRTSLVNCPSLRLYRRRSGLQIVFLVQDATCFCCHAASVSRPDSLQPLDHEVLLVSCEEQQRKTSKPQNKISIQQCRGSATMIECALWRGRMQLNVIWHCYGLMKCQDETVSTMVSKCHYISLYAYKTQHKTEKNLWCHLFETEKQTGKAPNTLIVSEIQGAI